MSFNSHSFSLDGGKLKATSKDGNGGDFELNLDDHLGSNNGKFCAGANFSNSAREIRLQGETLCCELKDDNGSYLPAKLDLNTIVESIDGEIKITNVSEALARLGLVGNDNGDDESDEENDSDDQDFEEPKYSSEDLKVILLELAKPHGTRAHRYTSPPRTVVVQRLDAISTLIREKPDWWVKIYDKTITKKWSQELIQQHGEANKKDLKYVLQELKFYAEDLKGATFRHSPVNGVYEADDLFPETLTAKLKEQVKRLEAEPVDWHPNSNEQVRDLVHPSLRCYNSAVGMKPPQDLDPNEEARLARYNKRISERLDSATNEKQEKFLNARTLRMNVKDKMDPVFQWLPSEFHVDSDGKVKIEGIVNNLPRPKYSAMYTVLEEMVEYLLPMLERVMSDMATRFIYPRVQGPKVATYVEWEEFEDWRERSRAVIEELGFPVDDSDDDDVREMYDEEKQPLEEPATPKSFKRPNPKQRVPFPLVNHNLQIIVKFANIELTPEKPNYGGGSWHIEGAPQENIVASVIYYYDMDNITESKLSFRAPIDGESVDYEQDDQRGVEMVYGIEIDDDRSAVISENIGSIVAQKNRVVVFPNLLQHQVQPFSLADNTKPGYRKIMALFVVDPLGPVLSTKDAKYFDKESFAIELHSIPPFDSLPFELILRILAFTKHVMTLDEANRYREQLMEQRSIPTQPSDPYDYDSDNIYEQMFSLCEH
eukprot:m.56652 g.56652  ORF g.56652 m.56652 type:complete len:712 (-) comp11051_c0_seq2:288-2423(-)